MDCVQNDFSRHLHEAKHLHELELKYGKAIVSSPAVEALKEWFRVTSIRFNDGENFATVQTTSRQLSELLLENGFEKCPFNCGQEGGWTFYVPKCSLAIVGKDGKLILLKK